MKDRNNKIVRNILLGVVLVSATFLSNAHAQSGENLFSTVNEPTRGSEPWVISRRSVELNEAALDETNFIANLPGASLQAIRQSSTTTPGAKYTVRTVSGSLLAINGAEGSFTISLTHDKSGRDRGIHGLFSIEGRKFELSSRGKSSQLILEEIDETKLPQCNEPLDPGTADAGTDDGDLSGGDGNTAGDGSTRIDILVAYSPEAETAAGGEAAMLSQISNAVSIANQAYSNSLVYQQVNLVGTVKLAQAEHGDFSTDLNRIRATNDGYYDEVHALRDQLGADMVAMIIKGNGSYCGIGYLFNNSASYAFSVTARSCISNHTFTHELGHNMGSHHDRANASSSGAYAYSYGWRWNSDAYRSIMSYSPGARTNHISNPNVFHAGSPTGNAENDNARSMNNTKASISSFRSGPQDCVARTHSVNLLPSPAYVAPGTSYQYQVSVVNNDTACPSRNFGLGSQNSAGWNTVLDSSSLTVAAQSSGSTTLTISVPADAAEGSNYVSTVTSSSSGEQLSRSAIAIIDKTAPNAVTDLTGTVDRKNKVVLRWTTATDTTNGSGVGYYRVYRDGLLLQTIAGTSTSYTDSATTSGATHQYYLTVVDRASNVSAASNIVTLLIGGKSTGGSGGGGGGGKGGKK